jgi:hypothetical protein
MIKDIDDLNIHLLFDNGLYIETITSDYQLYIGVSSNVNISKGKPVTDTVIDLMRADSNSDIELNVVHELSGRGISVNIQPKELSTNGIYEELQSSGFIKMLSDKIVDASLYIDSANTAKKHLVIYSATFFTKDKEENIEKFVEKYTPLRKYGYKTLNLVDIINKRKHVFKSLNQISKAEEALIVLPSDEYLSKTFNDTSRENYELLMKMIKTFDVKMSTIYIDGRD